MKPYFSVTYMVTSFVSLSVGLLFLPDERVFYSLLAVGCVVLWVAIMAIDKRRIELQAEYKKLISDMGLCTECEFCGVRFKVPQWCPLCDDCYERDD